MAGNKMGRDCIAVEVDLRLYSLDALKRTLYWYTDTYTVVLELSPENTDHVLVRLDPLVEKSPEDFDEGAFFNRLLDNDLRVQIGNQTRAVRELIIAKAFSPVDLSNPGAATDTQDPVESGKDWAELCLGTSSPEEARSARTGFD